MRNSGNYAQMKSSEATRCNVNCNTQRYFSAMSISVSFLGGSHLFFQGEGASIQKAIKYSSASPTRVSNSRRE